MRAPSRPPVLAVSLELEGPLRVYPVCSSAEEEGRLAAEVLERGDALAEQVRLWGEAALERAGSDERWRPI